MNSINDHHTWGSVGELRRDLSFRFEEEIRSKQKLLCCRGAEGKIFAKPSSVGENRKWVNGGVVREIRG